MDSNTVDYSKFKQADAFSVVELQCDRTTNPLAVSSGQPNFSWKGIHPSGGESQTAYRIVVSSSLCQLESNQFDLWDTGKVISSESSEIRYSGRTLFSSEDYFWKAMIWDSEGRPSEWSPTASFGVSLLEETDWQARWLGYPSRTNNPILLRGIAHIAAKPFKAKAYVCGLGYYEFYVNGKRIGDHVYDPAWTDYKKRVLYSTYDITDFLEEGENVLGMILGKGRYGSWITHSPSLPPTAIVQVKITYENGRIEWFTSADRDSWMITNDGPIVDSSIYDGEIYDARKEIPGWNEKEYVPDQRWHKPITTEGPEGKLVSQMIEPIKVVEEIHPVDMVNPCEGIYVFDLGQNIAGGTRLRVRGEAGTTITIKFAEVCNDNGTVNMENLKMARCTDTYILKGGCDEIYEQHFTYHGFRYVQLEGCNYPPKLEDLTGRMIRSSVSHAGRFHCANDLVNQIHQCITWTEADNLFGIPTDCPQRGERLGWLNDLTVRAEESVYNFNLSKFYAKFIDDISDTQGRLGAITDTAPFYLFGGFPACPVSSSYLLLPWLLYLHYADTETMAEHYEGLKKWNNFLALNSKDYIIEYSYYGDWASPMTESVAGSIGAGAISATTPGNFMSTGYFYLNCVLLAKMAGILGRKDEEALQLEIAEKIKDAFNKKYFHAETDSYAEGSQASYVFPLYLGIVPPSHKKAVINNLIEEVRKYNYHLSTGNQCTKYLIEVLTEEGYIDIALQILTQTTYPSWGYMLSKGATTIWERWEYIVSGPLCDMASHNHPMHGAVDAWFYRMLAGIQPCEDAPGFERILIAPYRPNSLESAEASLETVKGFIYSGWKKSGDDVIQEIIIPFNSSADVILSRDVKKILYVTECGKLIWDGKCFLHNDNIRNVRIFDDQLVASVGSGHYEFVISIDNNF